VDRVLRRYLDDHAAAVLEPGARGVRAIPDEVPRELPPGRIGVLGAEEERVGTPPAFKPHVLRSS
jgi:hypothetical protein